MAGLFSEKAKGTSTSGSGGVFANKIAQKKTPEELEIKPRLTKGLVSSHTPKATLQNPTLAQRGSKAFLEALTLGGKLPFANKVGFINNALNTSLAPAKTKTEKAVEFAGRLHGDLPYIMAGELLAGVAPVAKGLSLLKNTLAQRAATGAVMGAGYGTAKGVLSGEKPIEVAKEAGKSALEFGALDLGLGVAGKAIGAAGKKIFPRTVEPYLGPQNVLESKPLAGLLPEGKVKPIKMPGDVPSGPVIEMRGNVPMFVDHAGNVVQGAKYGQRGLPAPNRLLLPEKAQAATVKPSTFMKSNTPLEKAQQELNAGIEAVQNYIRHNDLLAAHPPGTSIEVALVDAQKATGINLNQLVENLAKAETHSTQSITQAPKMGLDKVKMANVAGVAEPPKLKRSLSNIPRLTPSVSSIEPPKVEPLLQFKKTMAIPKPLPKVEPKQAKLEPKLPKIEPKLAKIELPKLAPKVEPKLAAKQVAVTVEEKALDATKLKDISGFRAYTSDVYRNFRDVFGNQHDAVKKRILEPFDASKKANVDMQKQWADKLKTEVVDRLGIKKGSKLSALVQKYGEKTITENELKSLAPDELSKIKEADKWFRQAYDQLLDEVNAVRAQIYPNSPDKIVPKRQDYYRHFRELSDTIEGVKNLFDTPAQISPDLAGVSDFTLPKSRFAGFMQKRGLGPYKNDAVGGFLEYLPAASYAKNIDPHIGKFEALAQDLADSTIESKNINSFIEYLRDFSRDLAGKTNPADRFFQKIVPGGRATFKIINWLNNRVKANAVLGNIGSALAQTANIPQGIAFAKQHSAAGFGRTVKGILTKTKGPMSESGFLAERYSRNIYSQFDTRLIDKPKQYAAWLLEAVDRIGTEFIWNSAYAKGVAEKVANPIKYADNMTRSLVAGRGIGEVPLLQKSRLFQIMAPFQLEVANLWNVQRDFVKAKDFGGLVGLYLANFMFNKVMEETRGSGVTFDPINAIMEAFAEEDTTAGQKAGRLAGEVLSNVPLGQNIAAQLPEDKRKALFGKEDPTRFGTGLAISKGLTNPLRIIPPFGGAQAEKLIKGGTALGFSPVDKLPTPGVYNQDKTQLKYPVSTDPVNTAKGLLFGTTGLKETKDYYENNRSPLGEKQTEQLQKLIRVGANPQKVYGNILKKRELDNINKKIKAVQQDKTLTAEQKQAQLAKLLKQKKLLQQK